MLEQDPLDSVKLREEIKPLCRRVGSSFEL